MNLLDEWPPGPDVPKLGHFFKVPKQLEGEPTKVLSWERATVAREQILYAGDQYRQKLGEPEAEA